MQFTFDTFGWKTTLTPYLHLEYRWYLRTPFGLVVSYTVTDVQESRPDGPGLAQVLDPRP